MIGYRCPDVPTHPRTMIGDLTTRVRWDHGRLAEIVTPIIEARVAYRVRL